MPANFRQGTELQSVHVCDFDPTIPPGVPLGTPNMLLIRTDINALYYYKGPLDTDWFPLTSGIGGGIAVRDEGVPVPNNPHTTLDFVGAGVVASDAGAGVAQVSIPGGIQGMVIADEGIPIPGGPHTALNFIGAGVTAADAGAGVADITILGGGGAASQLLSIYGDGSFGDFVVPGGGVSFDATAGAPGAPVVPAGSVLPYAFYNNLTVPPGETISVGGPTGGPKGVIIFVKDTLTIGAGGSIISNGSNGGGFLVPGLGRAAIFGSSDGTNGGTGNPNFAPAPGAAGGNGSDRPAQVSNTMVGGAGGAGGTGFVNAGGAGGINLAEPSWPYSLNQAISIADLLTKIGGGNGGGGGGNGANGSSGSGGGGGGTLVIFAKNIVAPAGSIQCRGGNGGAGGPTTEGQPQGGGGGGSGGTILIVTENITLAGVTDVSGGLGGAGAGVPSIPAANGGPGQAVAFNPMLAALIPV